jgi:integrase/recombinase XerD
MSSARVLRSALGTAITSYLSLKKALGRNFTTETAVLVSLDRFLVARHPDASALTPASFIAWSLTLEYLTPTVRRNRMRIVRNLCLYMRRRDSGCFVPDTGGFPARHVSRRPHIFTEEQIVRLIRATAKLPSWSTSPLRADVYRLAIVLLYTTGLRREELVRLSLSDYDAGDRTLLVRASKFHKSRLVALSPDGVREIERYLRVRRRLPHRADAPLLVSRSGEIGAYWGASIGRGLRQLFQTAGVFTTEGRIPRVHDLRHTYAVHTLLRWYRTDADLQAKLPILSTAMGHVSIASTAHYLTLLEPVADAASSRFAEHCRAIFVSTLRGGDR